MNLLTQLVTVTRFVSDGTPDSFGQKSSGSTSTIYEDYPCRVYQRNLGTALPGKEFERGANIYKSQDSLAMEAGIVLVRDDTATVEGVAFRVAGGGDVRGRGSAHHSEWEVVRVT